MIKRYKTILSLLLVVLTCCAIVTVSGVVDINKIISEREKNKVDPNAIPKSKYEDDFDNFTDAGVPLLKTDVENIYYAMDQKGNVTFYKIADAKIEEIEATGTFDVEVVCSAQTLPATITYLETDEIVLGYGLFTNEKHPEVYLYDYAFFKVTNQFSAFSSRSDLLLLVDVDKTRFYSENKIYSENFYLYESHETAYFLNEDQRIVDLNARYRTDYKMFTNDILHQEDKPVMFFSSRFYNDFTYSNKVDIFTTGGSGENVDNIRYVENIASLNFWRTEDGVLYFVNQNEEEEEPSIIYPENITQLPDEQTSEETTQEGETTAEETTLIGETSDKNADKIFTLMLYNGEEEIEVISFKGDIKEDYIICGSYIMNKNDGDIYNVVTNKYYKFDYSKFETSFTADMFTISENGKYCIVRGKNNLNKPSVGIMDINNNKYYTYTDNVFGYVTAINALNDGTIVLSLATGENATTYYQLIMRIPGSEKDEITTKEPETDEDGSTIEIEETTQEVEVVG